MSHLLTIRSAPLLALAAISLAACGGKASKYSGT